MGYGGHQPTYEVPLTLQVVLSPSHQSPPSPPDIKCSPLSCDMLGAFIVRAGGVGGFDNRGRGLADIYIYIYIHTR